MQPPVRWTYLFSDVGWSVLGFNQEYSQNSVSVVTDVVLIKHCTKYPVLTNFDSQYIN